MDMSPSSSGLFAATLRKILLIILPERVLGRPCATCNENICSTKPPKGTNTHLKSSVQGVY